MSAQGTETCMTHLSVVWFSFLVWWSLMGLFSHIQANIKVFKDVWLNNISTLYLAQKGGPWNRRYQIKILSIPFDHVYTNKKHNNWIKCCDFNKIILRWIRKMLYLGCNEMVYMDLQQVQTTYVPILHFACHMQA